MWLAQSHLSHYEQRWQILNCVPLGILPGALLDYAKILDSELARLSQLNVNISVVHWKCLQPIVGKFHRASIFEKS